MYFPFNSLLYYLLHPRALAFVIITPYTRPCIPTHPPMHIHHSPETGGPPLNQECCTVAMAALPRDSFLPSSALSSSFPRFSVTCTFRLNLGLYRLNLYGNIRNAILIQHLCVISTNSNPSCRLAFIDLSESLAPFGLEGPKRPKGSSVCMAHKLEATNRKNPR